MLALPLESHSKVLDTVLYVFLHVIGKALSGDLSCLRTGLVLLLNIFAYLKILEIIILMFSNVHYHQNEVIITHY